MNGKSLVVVFLVVIVLIIGNNLYQAQVYKAEKSRVETVQLTQATINVSGFDCPTCPISAEYALKDTKGVFDAKITSSGEGSRVIYDANMVNIEEFKKVLTPFVIEVVSQAPSSESKLN